MYEPDLRTSGQIVNKEKIRWLKNFTSKLVVQGLSSTIVSTSRSGNLARTGR